MNDVKKASRDFAAFIKRFRRKHPDLQYCAVLEPQANTAWHWHILCKFTDWAEKEHIYIDNNTVIAPMWGHGFCTTRRIDHTDNIGAYLGGYLASVEVTDENKEDIFANVLNEGRSFEVEEKEVIGQDGRKTTKRFLKGGRIYSGAIRNSIRLPGR